jgi:DNA-binding LacI/PurR family transcriptional regulator
VSEAQNWLNTIIFQRLLMMLPIVMFDRTADGIECDKVIVDDFDSALNSTQRLIDLGCKTLLYCRP